MIHMRQDSIAGCVRSSRNYNSGRYTIRRPSGGVPGKKGCPYRQVGVDDVMRSPNG